MGTVNPPKILSRERRASKPVSVRKCPSALQA